MTGAGVGTGSRGRAVWALAWRESRNARRRLLLFMSAISLGVAALVAIDSYSENVTSSVHRQSRSLLGADLALSSRAPFTAPVRRLLDSLPGAGIAVSEATTFASMAATQSTGGAHIVQVRAVGAGYPFYGEIETDPADRWRLLHAGRNALVDHSLLYALNAKIGDSLSIGYTRFAILGTLVNVPGDVGIASAFGPRVYVSATHLGAMNLLGFGSRAQYEALLKLPPGVNAYRLLARWRGQLDTARVRTRTAQDTERNLTEGVEQLNRFLGLVGLVALLLGGIGVASAVHAYVVEKTDTVAVLRCLGATGGQVLGIYVVEAAALGFLGAAAGVVIGVAAQFALPHVLGGFIPVDVQLELVPRSMLQGLGVGVWVATLFALRPLLALRLVSPLQALRRDAAPASGRRFGIDLPALLAALALALSVVTIAVLRAGNLQDGFGMSAGLATAVLVLWLAATLLSKAARWVVRDWWPFVMRQGIANLYRPANQTRPVVLALGFGAFLVSTLYLVQSNILTRLTISSEAAKANVALIDIQQDQVGGLDSIIRAAGLPVVQRVPIVPMRVRAINDQPVGVGSRSRSAWAARREWRSSFRDTLVGSERLVAGKAFGAWKRTAADSGTYELSLEQSVARDLGVGLDSIVTWDVQGVAVRTKVTSLREVTWARFEPNFFAVLEPAALAGAPKTFVILTHSDDPTARARVQRAAVDRYPNVSSIDLSEIQRAVRSILDKVALAVRFMALFSLATGTLVLLGAVSASRRQRVREGVLLRTLGATRGQVRRVMLAEYAALGALAAATGMMLSVGGAWALSRWLFKTPFAVDVGPLLLIALAMMLLTVVIGALTGRRVFSEPPMAALRAV